MHKKCSNCLILTTNDNFATFCSDIIHNYGVRTRIEYDWNTLYKVTEDVVICGSKYLKDINEAFYHKVVLILKEEEYPDEFLLKGIKKFIFDFKNTKEIFFALFTECKNIEREDELAQIIKDANASLFYKGKYKFDFEKNLFWYKGNQIYLTKSDKKYLALWLLQGKKDNEKRALLYEMRKRLGREFLSDIDRFGNIRSK